MAVPPRQHLQHQQKVSPKAAVASGSSVIMPPDTTRLPEGHPLRQVVTRLPEGHPLRQVVELIFSSGVTLWSLRCGKWR
jgi:hypothetical protein